jgi:hypothetical protein
MTIFMSTAQFALSMVLLMLAQPVQSAPPDWVSFNHNDWQLACDNTRTCRAAGYQSLDDELAVSVLLTRVAGPGQAVSGEIMIGQYFESEAVDALPSEFDISLRIDDELAGSVTMRKDTLLADLSAEQVVALLDALTGDSTIDWVAGGHSWTLSDSGSTAVLLKMDEFQGRLNTVGALVRKGTRDESGVLPPLAVPAITAAALVEPQAGDDQLVSGQANTLLGALRATLENADDCWLLTEEDNDKPELQARRQTNSKILVSAVCARGAYNFITGYWVVADKSPYEAELITTFGTEYQDRNIYANNKDRGLGDCWSLERWTWDGERFVHTSSSTTGMCRGLAAGGAWSLPTLTVDIGAPTP